MKTVYMDYAATTYVKPEVLEEMMPYFTQKFGNPSSFYGISRETKMAIDKARGQVAKALNCDMNEVYFTGGGSESDNWAIKGIASAHRKKGNHIITTKIEHHAVLHTCEYLEKNGFEVTYLDVNEEGFIDLEELKNAITDKTILVSIMFANNEIGTIEPIEQIGRIAKEHNVLFHTDSVQAIGNVRIDVNKMNIDLLSMSSHKFYGPKGVGALYIREGVKCNKLQDGGHQERELRAGTENVAGIVGMGKAIEIAYRDFEEYNKKLASLRNYYIAEIQSKIPNVKINGGMEHRLPGNANISFKEVDGEELLLGLDNEGICASSGSACSTGQSTPSHVLLAIGVPSSLAYGALRVTFGEENSKEDVDYLIEKLVKTVEKLRN